MLELLGSDGQGEDQHQLQMTYGTTRRLSLAVGFAVAVIVALSLLIVAGGLKGARVKDTQARSQPSDSRMYADVHSLADSACKPSDEACFDTMKNAQSIRLAGTREALFVRLEYERLRDVSELNQYKWAAFWSHHHA